MLSHGSIGNRWTMQMSNQARFQRLIAPRSGEKSAHQGSTPLSDAQQIHKHVSIKREQGAPQEKVESCIDLSTTEGIAMEEPHIQRRHKNLIQIREQIETRLHG